MTTFAGIPVDIKITNTVLLTAVGVGVAYYFYRQLPSFETITNKLNPANPNNIVYENLQNAAGKENVSNVADHIFGAIDLLNPFAPKDRKDYAKQVYGIN